MPLGLYVDAPRHTILKSYDEQPLEDRQVRVRTEFASVKHGTMFHLFSGHSPFQEQRFDMALRLFVPQEQRGGKPPMVDQFIGHMSVGTVTEIGRAVTAFRPGDRVYGFARAAQTFTLPEDRLKPLVEPLSPEDAVCQDPAFFAYAAVRDARVCVGANVAVFGLGAIGQCMVQILRRAGCLHVIAVDPMPKRRALAQRNGADAAMDPTACDVAIETRKLLGHGADIAIEASGNYNALHDAIRSVRNCARVVTLGYYSGGAAAIDLGADYFHNRLELICSMPDWDNPNREYPVWDYARMQRTVLEMFRRRWLTSEGIVDPIVSFDDCADAFMRIFKDPSNAIKLGIRFN